MTDHVEICGVWVEICGLRSWVFSWPIRWTNFKRSTLYYLSSTTTFPRIFQLSNGASCILAVKCFPSYPPRGLLEYYTIVRTPYVHHASWIMLSVTWWSVSLFTSRFSITPPSVEDEQSRWANSYPKTTDTATGVGHQQATLHKRNASTFRFLFFALLQGRKRR